MVTNQPLAVALMFCFYLSLLYISCTINTTKPHLFVYILDFSPKQLLGFKKVYACWNFRQKLHLKISSVAF